MKKHLRNSRGSILMETVLVIPLYLVLLSGVFWVGDLALLRLKSSFFDRFAAWSGGNRHEQSSTSAIKSALEGNFLQASRVGTQRVEKVRTEAKHSGRLWATIAAGTVEVSVEPPVWTQNWRKTGEMMMEQEEQELKRTSFRSRETEAQWLHRTLMRTPDTYRETATPQKLGEQMAWQTQVYGAPWPDAWTKVSNRTVAGGSPCMKYERETMYVQWSE